jgi:hypothetical protein
MNINAIVAILVAKGILAEDEAERIVQFVNDKPQSTVLRDAIDAIKPLLNSPAPQLPPVPTMAGPAQLAEEQAARTTLVTPSELNTDTPSQDQVSQAASDNQTSESVKDSNNSKAKKETKQNKYCFCLFLPVLLHY